MARIYVQRKRNKEEIEKVKGTNGLGSITYHWINKLLMLGKLIPYWSILNKNKGKLTMLSSAPKLHNQQLLLKKG